jgi:hypothetical protein
VNEWPQPSYFTIAFCWQATAQARGARQCDHRGAEGDLSAAEEREEQMMGRDDHRNHNRTQYCPVKLAQPWHKALIACALRQKMNVFDFSATRELK